ncbi:MAG TPA: DUF4394 domain-containing protein, partial [Solirubrobacterales bacterium]|nr:DUF4394 domain-containing protein [Solirubrobacterales bacterium]
MRRLALSLLVAISAAMGLPSGAGAQLPDSTLWGLPGNGNSLVQFRADGPSVLTDSVVITGLQQGERLAAVDFRPRTGQLYGIGVEGLDTIRVYTINTDSGRAAQIPGSAPIAVNASSSWGMGFNPTSDRIRVVNSADENMRINPNSGARSDSPLNDTDLNPASEIVTGVGYDRSFDSGAPVGARTTLYGIAAGPSDTLVTIGGINSTPSPNTGIVNPVGEGTGLPLEGDVGLDVGLDGRGYASATLSDVNVFFLVNLTTGSFLPINAIADGNLDVESLAVVPPSVVATATGTKGKGLVQVSDAATREQMFEVAPFNGKKTQGIRVALGDLDLDSTPELIAAPGPKGKPKILTFDDDGAPLATIDAYDLSFRGGVFVGSGDIDADGYKDIIAAAGKGKTDESQIKVFDGETNSVLVEFDAFTRPFKAGVTVAAADFDLDGDHEIVAGEGGGASVRVFDESGSPFVPGSLPSFDNDFEAFPAGSNGGISVAAGDVNGDGTPDIVAGAGPGEAPEV